MLTSRYAEHIHSHLIFANTFEIVTVSLPILQMTKLNPSTSIQTLEKLRKLASQDSPTLVVIVTLNALTVLPPLLAVGF